MSSPVHNVAIGIVVHDARILVCRRLKGDRFADQWEFPGGKLMEEESAEACMHRELHEELAISVTTAGRLAPIVHDYGDFRVCLHPFIAELDGGQATALASQEVRWVSPDDLQNLDFPEANRSLVSSLPSVLRLLKLIA